MARIDSVVVVVIVQMSKHKCCRKRKTNKNCLLQPSSLFSVRTSVELLFGKERTADQDCLEIVPRLVLLQNPP